MPGLFEALKPLGQALAPIGQALAPVREALTPLRNALGGNQAQMADESSAQSPTFDMLNSTFNSPAVSKVNTLLQSIPGLDQAHATVQQSMSPLTSQLLNRVHSASASGQPFNDWFKQTGFPGLFAGFHRWPPEVSQRLFTPEQSQLFQNLNGQVRMI